MHGKLQEIGEAFLNAPFGSLEMWDTPLRQLAEVTGSPQVQLIGHSLKATGAESVLFHALTDADPRAAEDYFTVGADKVEVNWKVAMHSPPLQIMHDEHYREVESRRSPKDRFTEYLQDYNGYNGAHVTLIGEDDAQFTLALLRNTVTTAEQLELFRAIAPYAHAAALMQRSLEGKGFALAGEILDKLDFPVLLLDRQCQVRTLTKAAEDIVRSQAPLDIRAGRLRALSPADNKALQAAIRSALAGQPPQTVIVGAATTASKALTVEVFALPRREWSFGFEPRVLVSVRQPRDIGAEKKRILSELFQLTSAESDVALHIANGLDRDTIAARRGSSSATVAEQLKSIFRKTDVRREGTLIALLNRMLRL